MNRNAFIPTRGTLIVLLLASMLPLMGAAAVAPALPLISEAFPDVPESIISMIITLPSLAVAFTAIFVGMAIDRIGKVPIFVISLLLFTVAGVSGYFLDSIPAILLGRIILGIGLGGILTAVTALITSYYTGAERDKIIGYEGAFVGFGILILETSGGALAAISWREPFLIYLIGLVILAGVLFAVREPAKKSGDVSDSTHTGPEKINIPLTLMIGLTTFFLGFMLFLLPTKIPYLMESLFPGSSMITGLILGTVGVFSAVAGLLYGIISRRLNRMTTMSLVFLMTTAGLFIISVATDVVSIGVGAALTGFAAGTLFPSVFSWLAQITPVASIGFVVGIVTTITYIGEFSNSWIVPRLEELAGSQSGVFFIAAIICLIPGIFYGVARIAEKRKEI